MLEWLIVLVAGFVVLGAVLHRIYALRPPPASWFPAEGSVFRSEAEGFTQRIVKVDDQRVWVRLTLDPHAPGPAPHVHTRFAERFRVASGRVTFDLNGETRIVSAGEEFLVPPGTAHRLRNTSGEVSVVEGPTQSEFALPKRFGLFLAQAYAFFDESPRNARPPRVLLQMSFWSPIFDIWLAKPPIAVQRLLYSILRPVAWVLGYRPWYRRFASRRAQKTKTDAFVVTRER